jgi:hypothetical protein
MIRTLLALSAALLSMGADAGGDTTTDLLSGRIDPITFDYGTLRDRPDADVWLAEAETRARREIMRRQGVADDVAWEDAGLKICMTEAELATLKGLASARKVKSRDEWRLARVQADDALAKRESIQRIVFAGEAAPYDELKGAATRLKLSKEAKDPVVAELFRRQAQDNFSRLSIGFSARNFMLEGMSDAALDLYDATIVRETCLIDAANLAWIKPVIAERGWFRISRDGPQADAAARNIVQHADDDPVFQQRVLALLETELAANETEASGYAYLYDRVAVNTGKPQRYATQGRCAGPGDWRPDTLEDPANVEKRRAEVGIDWPMPDYIAKMNTFCR